MTSMIGRIGKVFQNANFDAILIMNTNVPDSNFLYLTGFTSGVFEGAFLIVLPKKLILLTNQLEYEIAKRQKPKEMAVIKIASGKEMIKLLKKYLRNKVVGINGGFLPYSYYKVIKKKASPKRIIDVEERFDQARVIKESDEISKIKTANNIVKGALKEIPKYFKAGMTEEELTTTFNYLMMKKGASGPSFSSIICFGETSALPHHSPDSTKLRPNNFVLIDAGARYKNYCSDVTRTFIFKPDKKSAKYKKMLEMYEIVKKAQKIGLKSIKPGINGSTVHNKVEEFINTASNGRYKGKFIHSLGHSIGIEVHDGGASLSRQTCILKQNMILSDEPGIYVVGLGGVRFEDDVLITKNGAKFL